ncbi:anti-sigma factor [Modicisalibacter radicis]|uniref:anti-sigma factor n=1 Tax=Halomonas sp. EAR18 TaxID=2518972 RepID=UPI00109C4466|nr:anti-sigma factor [Halomonas sp. EAR18]
MTDADALDMLAAEFVLGTLDARERASVARRRLNEPELEACIQAWEARLAPLGDEIESIAPSPDLLARIERRIDALDESPVSPQVVALRGRLKRWQWSTGLASLAALLLAAVLLFQPRPAPDASSFVAVFQENDQQPAFLLAVDLENRQLSIRPVTAEPLPNRSYQLWIKADPLGPKPRSVGVLNADLTIERSALRDYDPELLKQATFGISVEPEGGSPTGQPTGPAIHGYLYPTDAEPDGQRL